MERRQKIAELFAEVLEKEPTTQIPFLEQKCGDDAEMIAEIKELIEFYKDASSNDFLGVSALAIEAEYFAAKESDARIGETLGRYKLIEKIGAGGMGAIYLAERIDEEIRQRVAVKIIKRGMDSEAILKRFRHERQILATLEHPNIARFLDAGTTADNLPFFVMELVEGLPIDEYCRAKNLPETERLDLFRKVCAAVSFAHHKLIVHRDLKPSNILINEAGEPKLLDFGIAKLLDSTDEATQTNQRALTPAYASPEQLRGEIVGTASDVYSLGVILKELLTERLATRTKWKSEKDEPKSAGRTDPNLSPVTQDLQILKGDLRNIVLKSLHEDAARRYQSVEQFSEDIRRYLAGLPITARKDSFSYRASKFVQRNRFAVAATILLVLSLAGGLAATLWQFQRAQAERARAERRFDDVRTLVGTYLSELNDEMAKVSGATKARQLLVQRTLEYLDKTASEAGDDVTLKRELAAAYIKVGDIQGNTYYQNFGDTSGTLASYQKALTILESLVNSNAADAETKIQLAKGYESLGDILWDKGDLSAARESYGKAVKVAEAVAFADPGNNETQLYLSQLYTAFGDIEYLEGEQSFKDMPTALDYQNKSLAIREKIIAVQPDDRSTNIYLNQSYQRLINLFRVRGDSAAEYDFLQKDKNITERLLAIYPNELNRKREVAICYIRLARYFIAASDFKQADDYTKKSMLLREEIYNADVSEIRGQRDLAFGYSAMADLQLASGNLREALANYQKTLKIYEALAAIDSANKSRQLDLIGALIKVGNAFVKNENHASALENFNRALEIARRFPADDLEMQMNLAEIYEGIGNALLKQRKANEGADNFQKAVELRENEIKTDDQNMLARAALARNYYETGEAYERSDKQTARNYYEKSLADWQNLQQRNALLKIDAHKLEETFNALKRLKISS